MSFTESDLIRWSPRRQSAPNAESGITNSGDRMALRVRKTTSSGVLEVSFSPIARDMAAIAPLVLNRKNEIKN